MKKSVQRNVQDVVDNVLLTHEKKLRNLTKNSTSPFTKDEVITNSSSYVLSDDESYLLSNALSYAIPPIERLGKFASTNCRMMNLQGS